MYIGFHLVTDVSHRMDGGHRRKNKIVIQRHHPQHTAFNEVDRRCLSYWSCCWFSQWNYIHALFGGRTFPDILITSRVGGPCVVGPWLMQRSTCMFLHSRVLGFAPGLATLRISLSRIIDTFCIIYHPARSFFT